MLDLATIRRDSEVEAIMEMSEKQIEALGFTEHSRRHAGIVSKWSGEILRALGNGSRRSPDICTISATASTARTMPNPERSSHIKF